MADWAKTTLIRKVLIHLRVLAAGQSSRAEDSALVSDLIDSKHDELQGRGMAPFTTDAIPTWAQEPLVAIVGFAAAPKFGYTGQRLLEKRSEAMAGEIELRRQLYSKGHPVPVRYEYF